jgi:hypothetical protein
VLLQDRNDLLFRVPLALHRLVLSQGQTPVHPGSIQWGNVIGRRERRRQKALTVPIYIFGRLIALFATKPSRGLAMIDS